MIGVAMIAFMNVWFQDQPLLAALFVLCLIILAYNALKLCYVLPMFFYHSWRYWKLTRRG